MPEVTIGAKSSPAEVKAWISKCISTRRKENPDETMEQSVAICISIARKAGARVKRGKA